MLFFTFCSKNICVILVYWFFLFSLQEIISVVTLFSSGCPENIWCLLVISSFEQLDNFGFYRMTLLQNAV